MGTRTWKCFFSLPYRLWPTGFALSAADGLYKFVDVWRKFFRYTNLDIQPPWDYFLKLCSPVDRAKSIPDWPTEFQPVRECQISVDTKEYHSLHCSLQHLNRFVFAEQNILRQNFQTSRSSSALKLQMTFLKANVLFLNEKHFWKRRKNFIIKKQKTRHMDLKLLLIQSKEWLNYF